MSESQKVTEQRALTTSSGRSWLVIGGLLTVLCGGILVAMWPLTPPAVAPIGAAITLALYVAIVITRFSVHPRRTRLISLAVLTILIPITFIVCALIITVAEWHA